MVWQSGMRLIQVLCVVLVQLWEGIEETLDARMFTLADRDQPVNIIFALCFPPIGSKVFRVDNNFNIQCQ